MSEKRGKEEREKAKEKASGKARDTGWGKASSAAETLSHWPCTGLHKYKGVVF